MNTTNPALIFSNHQIGGYCVWTTNKYVFLIDVFTEKNLLQKGSYNGCVRSIINLGRFYLMFALKVPFSFNLK